MRRLLVLLALPLLASACDDEVVLTVRPNSPPVAVAFIDNGPDNAAEQRLGYYILGQTARLDATASEDADNTNKQNLAYIWTFDRLPVDAFGDTTSSLSDGDIVLQDDDPATEDVNEQAYASFVPDAVGTYRLSLTVEDGEGAPSMRPAIVTVQVLPPSDLQIELEWEDTRADLDLHLVAPGGDYFVEGDDCFSWYPNPSWGESALATDNPVLSGDADGEGSGPYRETINLEVPFAGDFEVYVHYYSDHKAALGLSAVSANPTLDVTVFGQSILSGVASPDTPLLAGDVWYAGIIQWPSMEFAYNGQILDHTSDLNGPPYNEQL
jgi:hypothetical protein